MWQLKLLTTLYTCTLSCTHNTHNCAGSHGITTNTPHCDCDRKCQWTSQKAHLWIAVVSQSEIPVISSGSIVQLSLLWCQMCSTTGLCGSPLLFWSTAGYLLFCPTFHITPPPPVFWAPPNHSCRATVVANNIYPVGNGLPSLIFSVCIIFSVLSPNSMWSYLRTLLTRIFFFPYKITFILLSPGCVFPCLRTFGGNVQVLPCAQFNMEGGVVNYAIEEDIANVLNLNPPIYKNILPPTEND